MAADYSDKTKQNSNPDPITSAPGSHPVATGVGALAAGATGAAIGSVVPGVGTVIGGVVGAIAGSVGGGYAGKAVGEAMDPTNTDAYWSAKHGTTAYGKTESYDTYKPAYQYGAALADEDRSTAFDDSTARAGWETAAGSKGLSFDKAKAAIKGEFDRKLKLREEQLQVGKERVATGDVGVRKVVTTERKTIEVPVEHEEVVITRRAVSGVAGDAGEIADEEIRIPVSEERVTVAKSTVVTGEVDISKRKTSSTQVVSDDLRKEDVVVDKTGSAKLTDRTGD